MHAAIAVPGSASGFRAGTSKIASESVIPDFSQNYRAA